MTKVKLLLVALLLAAVPIQAATLLEANWDTGTGSESTAVRSGAFTSGGTQGAELWTVYASNGPSASYPAYLHVMNPDGDPYSSGWLYGHTSFASPTTIYIRFWARFDQIVNTMHLVSIDSQTMPGTPENCLLRFYETDHLSVIFGGNLYVNTSLTLATGTWYRLEFKITNAGTSSGSVEMRIDGVDYSGLFRRSYGEGNSLTQDAGSLTLTECNYFNITTYDTYGVPGDFYDIAGLKVTDGPDWIGDGASPALQPTPPTLSNVTISNGRVQ